MPAQSAKSNSQPRTQANVSNSSTQTTDSTLKASVTGGVKKFSIKDRLRAKTGSAPSTETQSVSPDSQQKSSVDNGMQATTDVNGFSNENIEKVWRVMARKLEDKELRISKIMVNNVPVVKSDTELHLELASTLQEKAIMPMKGQLVQYLRKSFNRPELNIAIEVNEKKDEYKAFTVTDRLEQMKQKNPALDLLMKKLDLDLD